MGMSAWAWICSAHPLGAIVPALLVPVWKPFRARLIEPRVGPMHFSAEHERRLRRGWIGALVLGVLVLLVGVGVFLGRDALRGAKPWLMPGLPAILVAFGLALSWILLQLRRFLLYAAVFLAAGVGVALLGQRPGWALLAGGLVTLTGGIVLFVRFLRAVPSLS